MPRRHIGSVCSVPHHRCLTPGTAQAPIVQEARWVPKPGWTGVEKRTSLGPIGIRNLNHSPRSELLCWLNQSGPFNKCIITLCLHTTNNIDSDLNIDIYTAVYCPLADQDHDISLHNHINTFGHALEHSKSLSLSTATLTNSNLVKMWRGGVQEPFDVTTTEYKWKIKDHH